MDYKKKSGCLFAIFLIVAYSCPALAEKIYRWVDENGVVGFTDNLSGLPEKYLDTTTQYTETEPAERVLDGTKPNQPDKSDFPEDLDLNGRDEAWWKDRVKELKDRKGVLLQERTRLQQEKDVAYNIWLNPFAPGNQNIFKINDAINQGKTPDPKLFFGLPIPEPDIKQSLTDLKSKIAQIDDELAEINHALEVDLPDEARRAGAPPGWLRD